MSLLGKTINEVIQTIYETIKSKRDIITSIQKEYLSSNSSNMTIAISRFKLIDLLDEFEITISQSLQGIQTLQTEICNLQEGQREILKMNNFQKDLQNCSSTIIPPNINDDLLFESIQTNNPINNSINETVSNIINTSQVYHKPKASKPFNSNSKLKFDYSSSRDYIMQNTSDIHSINKSNQELLISYSEIEGEPLELDKSRLPIRQSIRSGLSKQSPTNLSSSKSKIFNDNNANCVNDENSTISSKREEIVSKLNQIEKEKGIQSILKKISQKETYKIYFSDKHGNGKYEEFVRKLNRKEINLSEIEKELEIMDFITKTDGKSNTPTTANIKKVNSNPYMTNIAKSNSIEIGESIRKDDIPKLKRKYSSNKTETSFIMKNNQENNNSNPYIEPINFSSNFLRGNSSKSQRSNSKPSSMGTNKKNKQSQSIERKDTK